jgi:DNA-binding SARP family transcriptional activator
LAPLRICLTGRISLENGETLVEECELPGRQGRLAFAFLASERQRPMTKEELTSVVWPDNPPREVETALAAILSKLRAAMKKADPAAGVEVRTGTIQLRLPSDVWIDLEHAANSIDEAEGLHILSRITSANGEHALAVQYATEIIELEPFQETGYRHLMPMHAQMGNRGEAVRVFGKCRELFRDELGADPSQETERVFLDILRAGQ